MWDERWVEGQGDGRKDCQSIFLRWQYDYSIDLTLHADQDTLQQGFYIHLFMKYFYRNIHCLRFHSIDATWE